jgi:hypothetical protein
MLRLLVLLLVLANGGYFAWSQGMLLVWGYGPPQQSEPQRLSQQIRPENLRLLNAEDARGAEVAGTAPRPPECLQAGVFNETQVAVLRQVLDTVVGPAAWAFEAATEPPKWIVYMGRYAGAEAVNKKKAELRQLGVSFENVTTAGLEPGLSLGGFASQAAAQQQLNALSQRGVRTARLVQERAEVSGQLLRLPQVDDTLRPRLEELKTALSGKPLRACR